MVVAGGGESTRFFILCMVGDVCVVLLYLVHGYLPEEGGGRDDCFAVRYHGAQLFRPAPREHTVEVVYGALSPVFFVSFLSDVPIPTVPPWAPLGNPRSPR